MCPKTPPRDAAHELGLAILWLARMAFRLFAILVSTVIIGFAVVATLKVWHGQWRDWFELIFSLGFALVVLVCIIVFVGYHVEQFLAWSRRLGGTRLALVRRARRRLR